MNRGLCSCLLLWLLLLGTVECVAVVMTGIRLGEPIMGGSSRHQEGDDPRWADPAWDDTDWRPGNQLPTRRGVYWIRFRVALREANRFPPEARDALDVLDLTNGNPIDGIYLASVFAYQLYWDGRLIGGSGVVGATREKEVAGPLDTLMTLPAELLQPGGHVLAVRMSSHRYNFRADNFYVYPYLVNRAEFRYREGQAPIFPLIGTTAALLTGLICSVLYGVGERSRPLLICAGLGFALAAFYFLIAFRWLYNAPFDWFCPRLMTITALMTVVSALFPWLLLDLFAVPRPGRWLAVLAPLLVGAWWMSPIYEVIALWLCRAMLLMSLVIAGWAVWRQRSGARFVFVGVLVSLVLVQSSRRDFLSPQFLGTFSVLVFFVFGRVGLQARTTRRRMMEATVSAARLEAELLKKSLQPHFLLNSLTVLGEVMDQDPTAAASMIDDLGRTFRALSSMTGEKQVPLSQELELCRSHLRVLSVRTGRPWSLETAGVDESLPVPPATFLTLVENGVTHQVPSREKAEFRLAWSRRAAKERFTFFSPGEVRQQPDRRPGGTGLRYVRARLEESFPGRWSLAQAAVAGGWETVIELQREA
ncbi:MAG: histidine kinase [Opitutaceae bacterium]|nr:histidine kinase [Opitutaceae bacterium]